MKLYYSKASPYVRKVRTVIAHHALVGDVELKEASAFDANSPHNEANVLGRIPALEVTEGEWLYDSRVIAEYLDHYGKNTPLFPKNSHRWHVLKLQALGDGIVDNAVPIVAEKFFREDKSFWLKRHGQLTERNRRTLDYIQSCKDIMSNDLHMGTVTLVCAIDWLQFRKATLDIDVEQSFPQIFAWAQQMNKQYDCLQQTVPTV